MKSKIKEIATKFFYYWWNTKGNNTEQGFDSWAKTDEGKKLLSQFTPPATDEGSKILTPYGLAVLFHETYERLAPNYGYETRFSSRQWNPANANGKLMIAVCAEIMSQLYPEALQKYESSNKREFYETVKSIGKLEIPSESSKGNEPVTKLEKFVEGIGIVEYTLQSEPVSSEVEEWIKAEAEKFYNDQSGTDMRINTFTIAARAMHERDRKEIEFYKLISETDDYLQEMESLKKDRMEKIDELIRCQSENESLRKEIESLKEDAERWRSFENGKRQSKH